MPMAHLEPFRPVRLVEPSEGERTRAAGQYWAEPWPECTLMPRFHCVVKMFIGKHAFRVTLDTGAAQSLARASFVKHFRQYQTMRDAVRERDPIRPISCEGIVKRMIAKPMTQFTPIELAARDVEQNLRPPRHGIR